MGTAIVFCKVCKLHGKRRFFTKFWECQMSNETCHNGVSGNWFFEIEQPNFDFFFPISRQPMSLQDIETRFIPDTLWGFKWRENSRLISECRLRLWQRNRVTVVLWQRQLVPCPSWEGSIVTHKLYILWNWPRDWVCLMGCALLA